MFGTWNTGDQSARAHEQRRHRRERRRSRRDYIGSPHRFRIEWDASSVRFYIDGTLVHTAVASAARCARSPATSPPAAARCPSTGCGCRPTPRPAPSCPASTTPAHRGPTGARCPTWPTCRRDHARLEVRTGNVPTPDGWWTSFAPVAAGEDVATSGRYLQYRVQATSSAGCHPDAALGDPPLHGAARHHGSDDHRPHAGAGRHRRHDRHRCHRHLQRADGPGTITAATFTLRAAGAGATCRPPSATPARPRRWSPSADLATTPVHRHRGGHRGRPRATRWGRPPPGPSRPPTAQHDRHHPGRLRGRHHQHTPTWPRPAGEVILAPTVGAEFGGRGLPAGWSSTLWAGGSGGSTIANGTITLDQALLATDLFYTPGRSLEFAANFSDPNQHVGFANDFNNGQWAIFSTGQTGDQLYARSLVPGGTRYAARRNVSRWRAPVPYRVDAVAGSLLDRRRAGRAA